MVVAKTQYETAFEPDAHEPDGAEVVYNPHTSARPAHLVSLGCERGGFLVEEFDLVGAISTRVCCQLVPCVCRFLGSDRDRDGGELARHKSRLERRAVGGR